MVLFHAQNGFMHRVFVPLVLAVLLCDAKSFLNEKECGVPDLPAHSFYQCQPPLCQGPLNRGLFRSGTILEFFCQPGYVLAEQPALSVCQGGQWSWVRDVVCKPQGTSVSPSHDGLLVAASIPIIAGAALTLLAFLVMVQSCALLRLRPSMCHCHSDQYEVFDNLDMMEQVEEPDPVRHPSRSVDSLPSYNEVIYSHLGNPLPPGDGGPRPVVPPDGVLTQPEPHHAAGETSESPPPSYQEALVMAVASFPGGGQRRQAAAQHSFRPAGVEDGP